jgi:hypothetical protein
MSKGTRSTRMTFRVEGIYRGKVSIPYLSIYDARLPSYTSLTAPYLPFLLYYIYFYIYYHAQLTNTKRS